LTRWTVAENPSIHVDEPPEVFAAYYRQCEAVLDRIEEHIARLHDLGYVFVDLSANNVLIDDDGMYGSSTSRPPTGSVTTSRSSARPVSSLRRSRIRTAEPRWTRGTSTATVCPRSPRC
jgi:hypothetical protein